MGPKVGDGNVSSTDRFFVFQRVGLVGEFLTSTPLFALLHVFAKRPLGVPKLSEGRPSYSSTALPQISVLSPASKAFLRLPTSFFLTTAFAC